MSSTDTGSKRAIENLTGDYDIDPVHSRLGFVARHAMVTKVRGQFRGVTGRLHLDEQDPSRSRAEVTIDVASITTHDDQRDGHLRSPDFFDAEQHPTLTFVSTSAERVRGDDYRMTGDLTIKGESHPVTLDLAFVGSAKDPFDNLRVGFDGRGELNRRDWGLTWNAALETGGWLVSDRVQLELDISAIRVAGG